MDKKLYLNDMQKKNEIYRSCRLLWLDDITFNVIILRWAITKGIRISVCEREEGAVFSLKWDFT